MLNSSPPQHALCKMCNFPSLWMMFVTTPLQPFSPHSFSSFLQSSLWGRPLACSRCCLDPRTCGFTWKATTYWGQLYLTCFSLVFWLASGFFSVKHHYFLHFCPLQECLLWSSVPKSWFHSFNRLSKDRERKMDNLCSVWPSKPALKKWLKWVMYISIVWWTCHGAVWLMGLGMALVCLKINYFAWAIYLKALVCS